MAPNHLSEGARGTEQVTSASPAMLSVSEAAPSLPPRSLELLVSSPNKNGHSSHLHLCLIPRLPRHLPPLLLATLILLSPLRLTLGVSLRLNIRACRAIDASALFASMDSRLPSGGLVNRLPSGGLVDRLPSGGLMDRLRHNQTAALSLPLPPSTATSTHGVPYHHLAATPVISNLRYETPAVAVNSHPACSFTDTYC